MRLGLFAFLLLPLSAPAAAMPVSEFLAKAERLEKMGMRALFAADFKVLRAEMNRVGKPLKAERLAAERAGRAPAYCPRGKPEMGVKELLGGLRAIPGNMRGMDMREAMKLVLARRYPCKR